MTPHERVRELLALANNDLYVARVLLPDPKASNTVRIFRLDELLGFTDRSMCSGPPRKHVGRSISTPFAPSWLV